MKAYALVHRTCGHVGGIEKARGPLEQQKALLFAAGYHQWRIELMDAGEAARRLVEDLTGCSTCAVSLPPEGGAA